MRLRARAKILDSLTYGIPCACLPATRAATVDRNLPGNLDPAEARWTQAALPEHNARFLPANASYARWISCPWAQFSLGFISHSTLVSSIGARRAPAPPTVILARARAQVEAGGNGALP